MDENEDGTAASNGCGERVQPDASRGSRLNGAYRLNGPERRQGESRRGSEEGGG